MTGGDLDSAVAAAKETAADGKNRTRGEWDCVFDMGDWKCNLVYGVCLALVAASQRTSYALGTDPNDYHTEVQDRYRGEQNAESTTLNAELQKDLRAVHFKLGSDKPDYVSNYKAQHDDKSGQAERSGKTMTVCQWCMSMWSDDDCVWHVAWMVWSLLLWCVQWVMLSCRRTFAVPIGVWGQMMWTTAP